MLFPDFDITKTIHDYDYTSRAKANLQRLTSCSDLSGMDEAGIRSYLTSQMELVSFGDYLKRYIYTHTDMSLPFRKVPPAVYEEIILESFRERGVPFSLEKTTRKPSQTISKWLEQSSVRRETVLLLGFGLGMQASEVSTFLTKVIKDEDFILADPFERVCHDCLQKGLPWAEVSIRINELRGGLSNEVGSATQREWEVLLALAKAGLGDDLQSAGLSDTAIERSLYSALPIDGSGNVHAAGRILRSYLAPVRLSRQRMSLIRQGKARVSRYDILSLNFLICAMETGLSQEERLQKFIESANESLSRCRMAELYPVNPFEAVLLLCMETEDPLDTYETLWEEKE